MVATTDYVRAWPQAIAGSFEAPFTMLGTDGFGRSDTRAALRSFFEVNRHHIVLTALDSLARAGRIERSMCTLAIQRCGIDTEAAASWSC